MEISVFKKKWENFAQKPKRKVCMKKRQETNTTSKPCGEYKVWLERRDQLLEKDPE